MIDIRKPLFKLGQIMATPGALAAMEEAGQAAWELVSRHVQGDWGEVGAEDAEANARSVEDGSRILSAYHLKTGERLWVLTEADRSSTCILLPDEY